MTLSVILGILICASPFIFIFAYMVKESGWMVAFIVIGIVALTVAILSVGSMMLTGMIVF